MHIAFNTVFVLAVALFAGCASRPPTVVELPRPNSGTFTFAQAEARKSEIYSLVQSGMKSDWKNPYMGFCVHITRDDEVVVYGTFFPFTRSGKMSIQELEKVVTDHPLEGNPLGVLITSERDPYSSAVLPRVAELLFRPSIQVFYVRRA
jgi:uncharacterized protein YpmS